MGAAYYIALERLIPDLDHFNVDGRAIVTNLEALDSACGRLELPTMDSYFSAAEDEVEAFLELAPAELGDLESLPASEQQAMREMHEALNDELARAQQAIADQVPAEEWFDANDGLAVVNALVKVVGAEPEPFQQTEKLLADLRRCAEILESACQHEVRFHFSIDF